MAAVTQTRSPKYNVSGSVRQQFYRISGANGDTLNVGLRSVLQVAYGNDDLIGYSVTPGANSQSVIAFGSLAPFTDIDVTVFGN